MAFTSKQVLSAFSWSGISFFVRHGTNLSVRVLLLYFLMPEDFGVLGMATAVVELIRAYVDMGIAAALIQRRKDQLSAVHFITAFWCNLVISWMAFCLIFFVLAPAAANYYENALLKYICIAISLPLLWSPLSLIARIQLRRSMNFKVLSYISVVSGVLGGAVCVGMVMNHFGVWCFVGQIITSSLVGVFLLRIVRPWSPRMAFSWTALRDLFSFGVYDVLIRINGFCNLKINALLLGHFFTNAIVGTFVVASALSLRLFSPLNSMFKSVFFPFFSGIQEHPIRIRKYYLMQIRITWFAVVLPLFILVLLVDQIVEYSFAEKWAAAKLTLRYLFVQVVIIALTGTVGVVLKSFGKMKLSLQISFLKHVVFRLPCLVAGARLNGYEGYLQGLVLSQTIACFIDFCLMKKYLHISIGDVVLKFKEVIAGMVGIAGLFYLIELGPFSDAWNLSLKLLTGMAVSVVVLFPIFREILQVRRSQA